MSSSAPETVTESTHPAATAGLVLLVLRCRLLGCTQRSPSFSSLRMELHRGLDPADRNWINEESG